MLIDRRLIVGPFQCNAHLLVCTETGRGVYIDPGDDALGLLELLKETETEIKKPIQIEALYHTHAHLDHIGATRVLREALEARQKDHLPEIWLHPGDHEIYQNLIQQGARFGLNLDAPLPVDHSFEDEQDLKFGNYQMNVIHTPGHSPGGVCFLLNERSETQTDPILFSGDTLFQSSVGRTDLWGGDMDQLLGSIRKRIFTLDGDITVCPGHGLDTKVGIERLENPFLK